MSDRLFGIRQWLRALKGRLKGEDRPDASAGRYVCGFQNGMMLHIEEERMRNSGDSDNDRALDEPESDPITRLREK